MRHLIMLAGAAIALGACTSASDTADDQRRQAGLIQCPGGSDTLASCLETATRECPAGFDMLILEEDLEASTAGSSGPRFMAKCRE
jgi:hypothetical protein